MVLTLKLIYESFAFAVHALRSNLLRTILSLLGVTIGIFAIIAVFTMVDSLEKEIRRSMNFLGDKVIYVQKWPWSFSDDYPWWKYFNRPVASMSDYKFLERNLQNASGIALFASKSGITIRHGSSSMDGVSIFGMTWQYNRIADMPIAQGRYFTQQETDGGRNVCLLGANVAEGLFPNEDPIGKTISGRKGALRTTIVGVLAKQGDNLLGAPSNDNVVFVPYPFFATIFNVRRRGLEPMIGIKGYQQDKDLQKLEGETIGLMRSKRGLKPVQEDNFAINRPEMIANKISELFKVIGFAGGIIGSFSILVGGFGIANIMFVSVKERTNLIGIQKSLGAKNYFILWQFLFESIFLSLMGGGAGIILVWFITLIPQDAMEIVLSFGNIMIGLAVSVVIGVFSGIIPAWLASKMDPVEAIRSK